MALRCWAGVDSSESAFLLSYTQVSLPPILHPFLPLSREPWTKRPRQLPTPAADYCSHTHTHTLNLRWVAANEWLHGDIGQRCKTLLYPQVLFTSQSCHAIDPGCIDMGCGYGWVLTQSQRQDKVVRVSKECAADTHRKCKRRVAEGWARVKHQDKVQAQYVTNWTDRNQRNAQWTEWLKNRMHICCCCASFL